MATYVIGDLQACYTPLRRLLDRLRFDPARDRLWFTGDLVNRGPQSLACLRYVKSLAAAAVTVLGNHDLHLVAAALSGKVKAKDTFQDVLAAPDRAELLAWLRTRPLVHYDKARDTLLVHAGLPPAWDADTAQRVASETSRFLASAAADDFLRREMYGDQPDRWDENLDGVARIRFTINCCTRLRYCHADGRIDLKLKTAPSTAPADLVPWFAVPGRRSTDTTVLFGHWSTLGQVHWPQHRVWGLDSGCVWGGCLSALNLDSGEVLRENCEAAQSPGD